jgi:hypothetical protein
VAKDNDDQQSGSTGHRVQGLSDIWYCDRPQVAALATQASRIWYLVYLQLQLQQESSCYCCTYSSHEPSHRQQAAREAATHGGKRREGGPLSSLLLVALLHLWPVAIAIHSAFGISFS